MANAKFMLDEEEHFQELMRERLRHFGERNREQDFWLAIEPEFLDKFPNISKRLKRPAVALVSTDELWITYVPLPFSFLLLLLRIVIFNINFQIHYLQLIYLINAITVDLSTVGFRNCSVLHYNHMCMHMGIFSESLVIRF